MKRVLALLLALLLMVVAFAGCGEKSTSEKAYVIGMSGPLTGGASMYGQGVQNGAQLAVDEINAAGGLNGVNFKLVALDDVNDASKIKNNYASLYEDHGMQFSLCAVTSTPGKEFIEYSHQDMVFTMAPSASSDAIPKYDEIYQMCFADGNQGKVAAKYVNENFAGQTIGVFYKSDDIYSQGIFTQFKSELDASVTAIETVFTDANTSDFSSQIDTLKACKFIFMPIYYTPAYVFMTQAKDIIAKDAVYYGCDGFDGIDAEESFDLSAIPQEISMLSHFDSKATEGTSKEFIDKYLSKFNSGTLNQFAASGYDSVYAIFKALKIAQDKDASSVSPDMSADELCEVLQGVFKDNFTFVGVTGDGKDITWDADGFVSKTAVKYTVKKANA